MKKLRYSLISILIAIPALLFLSPSCREYVDYVDDNSNVELECPLNITGGCFDQWIMLDDGYGFKSLEPAGKFLRTLNYLYTLPEAAGGPGPLTTDSTTDSYSGKHAALLITGSFSPMGTPIIIPGLVGTDSLDIPNATIHVGKRYTSKPLKFQGYYKYEPSGGDSALVSVLLTKYNTIASKRDTIGFGRQIIKNTVSTYTKIELPIDYYITTVTPDTLTLLICSSAGINLNDLMHCQGSVGSKMWIDEISFVMP